MLRTSELDRDENVRAGSAGGDEETSESDTGDSSPSSAGSIDPSSSGRGSIASIVTHPRVRG